MRKIATRLHLSAATAAAAALIATPAGAQDLFAQGEKIGNGLGRAGSAILGPLMLVLCGIAIVVGVWALKQSGKPENRGRGHLSVALTAIIAAFIFGGAVAFITLGTNTVTGGAATASTAPFTLGGR